MIKLPRCPHCDKLCLGIVGDSYVVGEGHEQRATYLCPEKMNHVDPIWVEVLEVS